MNYGQLRDYALQLIRQYTIAGEPYAPTYNNQQDYLNQIPNLLNDALVYIASNFRLRDAIVELDPEDGEDYGEVYRRYALPEDLLEMKTNGLLVLDNEPNRPWQEYLRAYKLIPPDYILIPKVIDRKVLMSYYRRPQLVSASPSDDEPIDATLPEQYCAAYYVASHLVMHDSPYIYASLYNEFETKGQRLAPVPTTEVSQMGDEYPGLSLGESIGGYSFYV